MPERMKSTRDNPGPSPLRGIGTFGMIGWSIAVPTVGGAFLGLWLDRVAPQGFSWTIALILGGVVLGAFHRSGMDQQGRRRQMMPVDWIAVMLGFGDWYRNECGISSRALSLVCGLPLRSTKPGRHCLCVECRTSDCGLAWGWLARGGAGRAVGRFWAMRPRSCRRALLPRPLRALVRLPEAHHEPLARIRPSCSRHGAFPSTRRSSSHGSSWRC